MVLQPSSRETDKNDVVDQQKELMRDLLFSSTNMAAITSREHLASVADVI